MSPTDRTARPRQGRPHLTFAMCSVALCLSGCSNPLASKDSDYGQQVPIERLRRIDNARLQPKPPPAPESPADDPAKVAKARFENLPEIKLTVEQASASALEHNLDLKVAVVDPTIAALTVNVEEAKFESTFFTRALWRNSDPAFLPPALPSQATTGSLEPGVQIPLRTGGTATVSLPMSRTEFDGNGNELYGSDIAFSISQPLLRNAGREVNTASIKIANYNRQISEAQTKLAIINQISAVERAYWRLYQSRRNLDVTQQQYELAHAQLERAERQVRTGRDAEIEVTRAQSGVANRLDEIIIAQNNVLQRQRELKRTINMPGLEVDGNTAILIATEPNPVEYIVDPAALAQKAIDNRMELLEFELRLLADAVNIKFQENQTLPALDFAGTYRVDALGTSIGDSFSNLSKNRFDTWSVGANLDVPLGNESAKSRLRQSILTRLQRLSSRDARTLVIRQEVADAVDQIQAGWQRILATRQATILSARTLRAEQRQFDVGKSTSTDVLDASTRLAIAQLEEISSVVDYQIAQIDLAAATGTLLGAAHINWTPAQPDRGVESTITTEPDAASTQPPPAPEPKANP